MSVHNDLQWSLGDISEPDDYLANKPTHQACLKAKSEADFTTCSESGIFCYNDEGNVHYHCPSCVRHCENTLQLIQRHYNGCIATATHVLLPCRHDQFIQFTECRSCDESCPVFGSKAPVHYHCPCCIVFAHHSIFHVIKHQLNCCKSMMNWNPGSILPELGIKNENGVCNHSDESDVKFSICYKSGPGCCVDSRRECHFHCPCCNDFSDTRLTQLKHHQRTCCKLSNESFPRPRYLRMSFVLDVATAIDFRLIDANVLDRKRKNSNPPSIKLEKLDFSELDNCLFTKCLDKSCCVKLKDSKLPHYHCPLCPIYSARRVKALKKHYIKCISEKPSKPKRVKLSARVAVGELQCVVIDKEKGVFLVRGCLTGPGMPAHVIYNPPHHYYCDDGCRNGEAGLCKHLDACATFVQKSVSNDMSSEVQDVSVLGGLSRVGMNSKSMIHALFSQCAELGVPVIKHFKPITVSARYPCYIFLSVSSCTSPLFYSRSGRVKVTFSVKKNQFKCKCFENCQRELKRHAGQC